MGLGQWLAQSTVVLPGPLVFLPHVVVLLAWFVAPIAVILCGVSSWGSHLLGVWRVVVLLLGGAMALQSFWLLPVVLVFNPPMAGVPGGLIDTGLALGESVLWAGLGYALWVRKAEPLVRAEPLAL